MSEKAKLCRECRHYVPFTATKMWCVCRLRHDPRNYEGEFKRRCKDFEKHDR